MRIGRLLGFVGVSFVLVAGCASAPPPVGPTVLAPLPERVVVVPSFVPSDATAILRFDGRAIRETEIAYELTQMIAVSGTWSTLSAGSDADPVADVDVMLCAAHVAVEDATSFIAASWYFVLRHTRTHAEVEQRIARIGEVQGVPVTWAEQGGFRYANLPVSRGGFAPHIVVLSAVGELVVAPASDLARVLDVAAAQSRARRGDEAVDPWLRTEPDELVFVRVDLAERPLAFAPGIPPARSIALRAHHDENDHATEVALRVELEFAEAADAESARARGAELLREASDNMMVSLTPIGPVLRATRLSTDDIHLVANTALTTERARNLVRFFTDLQAPRPAP